MTAAQQMRTGAATLAALTLLGACRPREAPPYHSPWSASVDRPWVGPGLWANRLQDWRVRGGRLECIVPHAFRTVHLLTRRLSAAGAFAVSVEVGPLAGAAAPGTGSAGVLLGAGGGALDYRAAALIHHSRGPLAGLYVGLDASGLLVADDLTREEGLLARSSERLEALAPARLTVRREEGSDAPLTLEARALDDTTRVVALILDIDPARLAGSVAVVSHSPAPDDPTFWFRELVVSGPGVEAHPDRSAGPILGALHTLSRGTLRLTAQLMPLGAQDEREAELQIREGGAWTPIATAPVVTPGYTATFTVASWDGTVDRAYRVVYRLRTRDGAVVEHACAGTIRREPADADEIVVAAFTGNKNVAMARPATWAGVDAGWYPWDTGLWFPHQEIVDHVRAHRPDFLFFSGDQVYEGASPTGADLAHPFEDYLYKWYLWHWAFRELTADLPAVAIPDDHDVYHGNIWGAGGRATPDGLTGAAAQDAGGYKMSPAFVTMVERTQTSHLPAPFDPRPVEQGIGVYLTDILYGGVSFAVLEDRKFKSAPRLLLPAADVWNGWPRAPGFDPATQSDAPGAVLLGPRQLAFLEHWAADWSGGVWMKVALSQTLFANVATLPDTALTGEVIPSLEILDQGGYPPRDRPASDMDSNGWPPSGRNRALRVLRSAFAVHLAGDQHLGSTIQYGIDGFRDAGFAMCVPSVGNAWPRRWFPREPGGNRAADAPRYTGDFLDGFGNRMTVHAVSNPARWGPEPAELYDKSPGYGIARFDRRTRRITFEAWPRWADPAEGGQPYPGWPVVFSQTDNDGRTPVGYLPTLEIVGMAEPVVQIVHEPTGTVVSTLRLAEARHRPPVFREGSFAVRVGEPGTERWRVLTGLGPVPQEDSTIVVRFE